MSGVDDRAVRLGIYAEDRKRGMTLDEVTNFVAQAHAAGTPLDTPVYGRLGFRQQVQQLETRPDKATGPVLDEGDAS